MKLTTIFMIFILLVPLAFADDDYFFVKSTDSPYKVIAGEEFVVNFELMNKGIKYENVTAYVDGCPMSWECEEKTFSYESVKAHPENLTIKVGKNAAPRRYTLYLLLSNDGDEVARGDDKLSITVLDAPEPETLSVEEYKAKLKEEEMNKEPTGVYVPASLGGGEIVEEREATEEEMAEVEPELDLEAFEEEPEEETVVEEDKSLVEVKEEVVENLERMESDKGFVEYASVVLIILLAVTGVGAFMAWRRRRH